MGERGPVVVWRRVLNTNTLFLVKKKAARHIFPNGLCRGRDETVSVAFSGNRHFFHVARWFAPRKSKL